MRALLAILALMVLASVAEATTPVQTKTSTVGSGNSNSITFGATPTIGNTIVCGLMSNGTPNFSSLVGGSASWTQRIVHTATNTRLWVYDGPADGTTTITFTVTAVSATPSLICAELDGAYTHDASATVATGTTSPVQTNTVATVQASTFLFAVTAKSSGSTTGAPTDSFNAISLDVSNGRYAGAYRNVSSAGSYSTSWTTNATGWATVIVAYAAPSGVGGGATGSKSLTLLGVGE